MDSTRTELDYVTPALAAWRRATDAPLMILAIGSLPVLLLEIEKVNLPRMDRLFIDTVNIVVLVAFAVDYLVGIAIARNRRQFVRKEYLSLIVVIAQAAALLPSLTAVGFLRSLRAARLFRLLALVGRAFAMGGAAAKRGRELFRRRAVSFALGTAAMTWITSAAAFTIAEDVGTSGRIQSFFDALWWSMATITTVGYGDIYPITAPGRMIGGFTMIVGISTFAVVTARVAQFLVVGEEVGPDAGGGESRAALKTR